MKTITTKKGQEIILRYPAREDAKQVVEFYNMVGAETEYLSFCAGEYRVTPEQQEKMIAEANSSENSTMILAVADDEIVGIGTISSNQKIKGAIALYEKCGFEAEGILKNEICIDGRFSNLVYMGLMI